MRAARRVAASFAVGLALTAASYAPPARAGIMDWINSLIAAPAAPMRETTSRFLDALKAGDGAKALAETSMAFKSGATADDLVAFGKGLKLDQYAGADWPEYRVQTELGKGTWGYIAGSLKGVAGELTPMTVGLAKEGVSAHQQTYITGDTSATAMGQTADTDTEVFLGEGVTASAVNRGMDLQQFTDSSNYVVDTVSANHGIPPSALHQRDASSGAEVELRRIPIRELRNHPAGQRIDDRCADQRRRPGGRRRCHEASRARADAWRPEGRVS